MSAQSPRPNGLRSIAATRTSSRKTVAGRGARGQRRLILESPEPRILLAGTPIVTEFMAENTATLADNDGVFSDWIEIHNPDPAPLSLAGWHLTDNDNNLGKWTFPAVMLDPGAYLVVFASNQNRVDPGQPLHTNFRLDNDGEFLALVAPDAATIAQAFTSAGGQFPQQYADVSYGLVTGTSDETYFLAPTPGAANAGPTTSDPTADVVVTEIMYHPLGNAPSEEYVELFNRSGATVDLSGWRFADGVDYTFPAGTTLIAGGYLVVAANVAAFQAAHPGATNVIGGWTGELSNTGEQIDLRDADGDRIDQVRYADEGDWAVRRRGPLDHNHRGWTWDTAADGGGSSLERISLALSNNNGQNWAASARGGTPGAANSTADSDVAPLIRNVQQTPAVPSSTEPVTIVARISDEMTTGLAATLFYRIDGAANFASKPMFDDGLHGDGAAGDGEYGATLNPLAGGDFSRALVDRDVIEYYVRAADAAANARTWPAPAQLGPNVVGQWSFSEGVGTRTVDLTGNGNEGRLTDGASFTPAGQFGGAVNLDGSDDRVVVEPRVVPEPPLGLEAFTLATWFRRTGNGVTVSTGTGGIVAEPLIAKGRDNDADSVLSDINYFLGLTQVGGNWVLAADFEEHISTANPGANHPLAGSTVVTDNVWHHAAASYDGTTVRLYLDGNLEGSLVVGRTPNWESTQRTTLGATLGESGSAAGGFEGQLDEAYIFDGPLAAADLAALIASNTYGGGPTAQAANALYQIDNSTDGASQPFYRIVMIAADKAELDALGSPATCADIMDLNARCDARSDAQFNATFIASSTVETEVRYTTGIRLRGNNTRVTIPAQNRFNNYRVNVPTDNPLDGRSAITLNVRDTESQLAGSVLWTAAGLVAADARAVQLRINGTTQLTPGQAPHYGSYLHLEAFDADLADEHFPGDGNGNLYRAVRDVRPSPDVEADLAYLGPNPDAYRKVYPKSTNEAEDNWSDLIQLTNVFTNGPDATFAADIAQVIDVDQWLRYLALDALLSNDESGLQSGIGDDYALYRGVTDPRFKLVPRDLDTLLGRGNTPVDPDENSIWGATGVAALDRLLAHPAFAPRYLQHLRDLAGTVLSPGEFGPLLDNALGGFVPQSVIDGMKTFMADRIAWIFTTQLNQQLTVSSALPLDTAWNRLRRTTSGTTTLSGQIDAIDTYSVLVNGAPAAMSTRQGTWSAPNVPLNPGINRVVVEAFDGPGGTGNRIGQTHIDVWYDTSGGATGASVSVPLGSVWKYRDNGVLPPNDAQGDTWREHDFDDVAWAQGPAQLGYGENDQATTIDCGPGPASDCAPGNTSPNKYITSYFRRSFDIAAGDAAKFDSLSFTITYDDGAVVYINGTEVDRFNMPAAPAVIGNGTLASAGGENTQASRTLDLNLPQWVNLLRDGVNTIAVEVHQDSASSSDVSFDFTMNGQEVVAGGGTTVPGGNLTGNITWSPQNGPYRVTGNVTVPAGSTLHILPGTSVHFDPGVRMTVNGIIDAQGTPHQRIRFSTTPGTAQVADIRPELGLAPPHWGGLHVSGSNSPLNIVSHADFEFAQPTTAANDGSIGVVGGGQLVLDDITNFGSHLRWIYANASSLIIRNSVLYDMFENCDCPAGHPQAMTPAIDNIAEHIKGEGGIPAGGHFIIEGNVIGRNRGHNDNIDVDSEHWPNPILVIRNNVFLGTGDEAQDGGGDFLFEGNIIGDFQKDIDNDGTGDSNIITTGDTETTVAMIVRNQFTKIDHVVNFKTGSYGYFENNTVVDIAAPRLSLPTDPPSRMLEFSAINYLIPNETNPTGGAPRDWPPGLGTYTAGNIFVGIPETVFGHVDFVHNNPAQYPFLPQVIEVHDTLVPSAAVLANADGAQGRVFDYTVGDPRFLDRSGRDYRLGPGSPAIGTGPNGIDMGALVASGASISGEPLAITSSTSATLRIGGPGVLSFVYRLDGGPWSNEITILDPRANLTDPSKIRVVDLPLAGLSNGPHTVEVRGRNFAGELQATPTVSRTWIVDASLHRVELSEVLANNAAGALGTTADLIELYNPSAAAFDLSDMSITDNAGNPRKFVFPAGTSIPAGGFLVVRADDLPSVPGEIHVGFSLKANEGDGVYLFAAPAAGGDLVDSVEFGVQIADYSIARLGHDGVWGLTRPSFGAANVAQQTGDARSLNINEWFTAGQYVLGGETHTNDFIELYNTDALPVALGGLHLTDDIVAGRAKFAIAPLSFVAPLSPTVFTADEDVARGADHANFRLAHEQGEIGLFAADGATRLDYVIYGPQRVDQSQGVFPDGGTAYQYFAQPSPGVTLDTTPPSVPQNLQLTPASPTRNDLTWDASADPQSGVNHYNVYRNGALVGTSPTFAFSDSTASPGVRYTYRVSAVNGDGFESAPSAPVSIGTDQTPPSVPTGLSVAEAIAGGNVNLALSWSPSVDAESGVKDYRVYRGGTLVATVTAPTYTDVNVSAASIAEYRVSARNADDAESAPSQTLHVAQLQDGVSLAGTYAGTADTWLNANNVNQQNGAAAAIRIDGQNPLEELGLIRWDLAPIPAEAQVQRASLVLNIIDSTTNTYEAYQALRAWEESQATFNIAATGVNWQTPGARGAADRGTTVLAGIGFGGTVPARLAFPLNAAGAALVGDWIAGVAPNNGLIISDATAGSGMEFTSAEGATAGLRPLLLVSYTLPASAPPTVVGVQVRGSAWSAEFLSRMAADGLGTGGYDLPHAASNATAPTLPWNNVNQISITFSEPVNVAASDLAVYGLLSSDYGAGDGGFEYTAATNTATWTTAGSLPVDRMLARLSGVTNLSGVALDGDLSGAFPSGDGAPGGDFVVRFNVLPGDNDASGATALADVTAAIRSAFRGATAPGYVLAADIDANGLISVVDAVLTRNHVGMALPNGEPAASPPASAQAAEAIVVELAADLRTARIVSGEGQRALRRETSARAAARSSAERDRAIAAVDRALGGDVSAELPDATSRLRAARRVRMTAV